jgi:preprotein translocase subunit SecG
MSLMFTVLLVVQIIASLTIISLVLLQQGKGADMGSAFGSGSAGSLFGVTGAANFLSRMTKWAAVVFFISTIGLAYVSNRGNKGQDTGIMQNFTQTAPTPNQPTGSAVPNASSVPVVPSAPSVPVVPGTTAPAVNVVPTVPSVPALPSSK